MNRYTLLFALHLARAFRNKRVRTRGGHQKLVALSFGSSSLMVNQHIVFSDEIN